MSHFILHCDLDCFFAAVEERDNPRYTGKPIVVGADPKDGKSLIFESFIYSQKDYFY